jgi:hypothetical protein
MKGKNYLENNQIKGPMKMTEAASKIQTLSSKGLSNASHFDCSL